MDIDKINPEEQKLIEDLFRKGKSRLKASNKAIRKSKKADEIDRRNGSDYVIYL